MLVREISIRKIFDSRGEATIEISGKNSGFFASVPSGKSRGSREATVLSYENATTALKKINAHIAGQEFDSIQALDNALINLDGTKNKKNLGGNMTLGISIAFSRALAAERSEEIWETLRKEFFPRISVDKKPLIFSNLINGGAHAKNNLTLQEYMTVVKPGNSMSEYIKKLISFYKNLGNFLQKTKKTKQLAIGDEGGYAFNFKNNFEPIAILEKLIKREGLEKHFALALDAAASNFYRKGKYDFEKQKLSADKLAAKYAQFFKKSDLLFSIEDPFEEKSAKSFAALLEKLPKVWVVGDDLTVTNPESIQKYVHQGAINAVIIKPNQIGTVSEACEAMQAAQKHNIKTIVSHRSGETKDTFIIHLAKAGNADGVKIGAPIHERILKFNELARIY